MLKSRAQQFSFRLLLISILLLGVSVSAQATEYLSIKKDGINIRKEPSTSSEITMELFEGWPLKVIEKKGEWYHVSDYENDTGWVYHTLVRKNNTSIVNVKKSGNMRSGPGKNYPVIAEVERGVVFTRLEKKGGWVKLKHSQGTVGWIYKTLLWPKI